ncbi:zinc-binding dehydrogenase [Bounagaea algeriensis]
MRAAVHTAVHEPMRIEQLQPPEPRTGEVAIDVRSCGACHSDLHVLKGELPFPTPGVLGHEVAGTVSALGPGVHDLAVGDPVVTSFIMPCGDCGQCARGNEDICERFFGYNRAAGLLYDNDTRLFRPGGEPVAMYSMGGLAERCITPTTAVYRVPDGVELADVASVGCSTMTAYGALRHAADVRVGDTIAVVGAGGVGSALIQLAAVFGASTIVAVDISDDKLDTVRQLGATHVVNAATDDAPAVIREITGGRGVDVAFEALGSVATFGTARDAVTEGGHIVVVGIAPRGTIGEFDLATIARRKLRISGSYGAKPRRDMPVLLDLVARGQLRPQDAITRRYDFDQVQQAYDALDKREVLGRAVIDIG